MFFAPFEFKTKQREYIYIILVDKFDYTTPK